ncbi:MAG: DUF1998 domain-containing protein [Magnetococcales bacterium]|nr:DUF1998 domain-containing protein [Magnetococcales bacterium]
MLRRTGLWTDLHDRIAAYAPFLRAQEHSAQIERPVLATYEERFKEGKINLLNCSTTMEMGVDIPHVRLVINANVPPSISNYRQRVGRAGRRGEPWAFGVTFCRDLPLDRIVFDNPSRFLSAPIPAPAVRLDSPGLVARHVHAALLAAFLRDQPEGFNLKASTGAFFGAAEEADKPIVDAAPADSFLDALRGNWAKGEALAVDLALLIRGTALEGLEAVHLAAETAEVFESILGRWRAEYAELLARSTAAGNADVKKAFELKMRRMKGEFLLGELARCGFTPSYGFPVDVVNFDHLSGHDRDTGDLSIAFGERLGGASRTLDVAIREYAPGGEVVVDGLVHRSEGVMPAWKSIADASKLEDLQHFWECHSCRTFGLSRIVPDACPHCELPGPAWKRSLRPTGFLGRQPPHTGYENLGHMPYEMPRLSAAGVSWQSLPDPDAGRIRADPGGQVITLGSGPQGMGYALCLVCGRAEAETKETQISTSPPPAVIRQHKPLAEARGAKLVGGMCPGGYTEPQRIQRHVYLIHTTRTDVFELQLLREATRAAGLALASALREALAERLGTEAREIGLAVGSSLGPGNDSRVSAFLYDRASGGAGLVSRLAEAEWFNVCLTRATEWLACPEDCDHGCPACILRPDLNFGDEELDRKKGLVIARSLCDRLVLPESLQLFGPETKQLELPLTEWLARKRRGGGLSSVTLYMHGNLDEWELADWPVAGLFARMKETGVAVKLVLASGAITDKAMELAQKLDLHRLTTHALLAHSQTLPMVRGIPVLAVVSLANRQIAIVAPAAIEAVPGPCWGRGADAALVYGPVPDLPVARAVLSDRLVALSGGNARLIRAGKQLDGPSTAFGRRFWALLATESPLTMAAIRAHGVRAATYTDRYLFTPFNLRLLADVISAIPGEKSEIALSVAIARLDRREQQGWAIFHPFAEDAMRRAVLEALLPGIRVDIRSKASLPHARTFEISLNDGREVKILLDQGFGAWRAEGTPRHDFRAEPAQQARTLKSLVFEICVEAGHDAPIVLEDR